MKSDAAVMGRPESNEYAPYYGKYISLVPDGDILLTLEQQMSDTRALLAPREADANFRYAPGKWSVKEALGHVIDTERVFSYRALRIARNDKTPLAGFEQDDYVKYGPFAQASLAALLEEFTSVRRASVSLFRGLDEAAWIRRGTASNNEVTVRALAYMIAGHELHHRGIFQ
ncbi:MAG: DinB family protein, partial [Terriglobales bacterium]